MAPQKGVSIYQAIVELQEGLAMVVHPLAA